MGKKFNVLPVSHSVRPLRITQAELAAADVHVTYDSVLDPETWKDAIDLRISDLVEVVGPSWTRTIRVLSLGPEGCIVEHVAGEQTTPRVRSVYLCRLRSDARHLWCLHARDGDTWQRLCPGQTDFRALVGEAVALMGREPGADLSFSPWYFDDVKQLVGDDQLASDEDLLLPEGTSDPDRWIHADRSSRGAHVGPKFHRSTLADQVRSFFYNKSNCPYGTKEPDWPAAERNWHSRSSWLLVRPGWSARSLWPDQFKELPVFPPEIEAAAAAKRERDKLTRKRALNRERAAENAKAVQEMQHAQIEAQREIYK